MPSSNVLGAVLIARHGDRLGFYQDPVTYDSSDTAITPLGSVQEKQLGQYVRSVYLNPHSSSYFGLSTVFNMSTFFAQADFADEGFVIYDSALALLQGLFPPNATANTITLANGSSVTGPFHGYQYIPIQSVGTDDVSLEGFTDCNTLEARTTAFYNSAFFKEKAAEAAPFLSELPPYLDGRPVTLQNMWNIFDFMNVQSIHNATFAKSLPPTFLAQARDLANWHEYHVFTDTTLGGIGNVAGTAMLPTILTAAQDIANASNPLKFHYSAISYKPFLSLFNLTGVNADGQLPPAIVNYAAALSFEIRQASHGGEPFVRFQFKNGTDDAGFKTYKMLLPGMASPGDAPLSTFLKALEPVAIDTKLEWCQDCNQTTLRGCDHYEEVGAAGTGISSATCSLLLAALIFLGFLAFGRRGRRTASRNEPVSQYGSVNDDKRPSS